MPHASRSARFQRTTEFVLPRAESLVWIEYITTVDDQVWVYARQTVNGVVTYYCFWFAYAYREVPGVGPTRGEPRPTSRR